MFNFVESNFGVVEMYADELNKSYIKFFEYEDFTHE